MKVLRHGGFTLVEMLVSMAVGTIVLLVAAAALRTTGEGYERSAGGVGAEREARAVMTQVAEDLSKAVSAPTFEFETGDGGEWRKDRLGFLCLQPGDAQAEDEWIGDLCTVVYYLKDLEIGGGPVRCLMRGFRGSAETFEAVRNGRSEELFDEQSQDEPVSFGVVSFEASPLSRTDEGSWKDWDGNPDELLVVPPEVVRLRLVVARRELLGKLRDAEDWDASPLLGDPGEVERSKYLEVYEVTQAFGHGS